MREPILAQRLAQAELAFMLEHRVVVARQSLIHAIIQVAAVVLAVAQTLVLVIEAILRWIQNRKV